MLNPGFFRWDISRLVVVLGVALLGFAPLSKGANATRAEEPKDHVIFVGLSLQLEAAQVRGQLVGLTRSGVTLATANGRKDVPLRTIDGVSLQRQPSLADTVVQLSDLNGLRTFTPAVDPKRMALEQVGDMQFLQEQRVSAAAIELRDSEMMVATDEVGREVQTQIKQKANAQMESAVFGSSGSMFNAGDTIHHADGGDTDETSDAYEVRFSAAAPRAIQNAYAVLVLNIAAPAAPHAPTAHVRFRALPSIGPEPRRFSLECTGLTPGYTVQSYAVHVYAGGKELATSLSDRAVAVTRSEAFQYLMIRYTLDHQNANLPPRVATEFLPDDFARRVPPAALMRSAEVRVDPSGRVRSVALDDKEPRSADDYVESVLRDAFFYPALVNGQPTETETTVEFSELLRR